MIYEEIEKVCGSVCDVRVFGMRDARIAMYFRISWDGRMQVHFHSVALSMEQVSVVLRAWVGWRAESRSPHWSGVETLLLRLSAVSGLDSRLSVA